MWLLSMFYLQAAQPLVVHVVPAYTLEEGRKDGVINDVSRKPSPSFAASSFPYLHPDVWSLLLPSPVPFSDQEVVVILSPMTSVEIQSSIDDVACTDDGSAANFP